eukprot:GHRQ01017656.1.p1 GENE.GHRQ01017656.1~~GHRQ01017656.1.p1  ORF type:complete len:264 (-),score=7.23 GHRQ01017656.1:339-1130(-)
MANAREQVALGSGPNCLSERFAPRGQEIFGWQNGADSRCLPVKLPLETARYRFPGSSGGRAPITADSRCYETSCTAAGQLQLSILGQKVDCPSGQTVDLAEALPGVFSRGLIGPCPDNAAACGSLACGESCLANGACIAGKCYCDMMFTGPSCGTHVEPGTEVISSNRSSAYVPGPDSSVRVPGAVLPNSGSDRNDDGVTAADGPIITEAAPRDSGDMGPVNDDNTVAVSTARRLTASDHSVSYGNSVCRVVCCLLDVTLVSL